MSKSVVITSHVKQFSGGYQKVRAAWLECELNFPFQLDMSLVITAPPIPFGTWANLRVNESTLARKLIEVDEITQVEFGNKPDGDGYVKAFVKAWANLEAVERQFRQAIHEVYKIEPAEQAA